MNKLIRTLAASAALACLAGFAPLASADVLSFDNISDTSTALTSYGGIDWTGTTWLAFEDQPGDAFTPHSGDWQVAGDNFGADPAAPATIRFLTDSVFDGAWFSGFTDSSVQFALFHDGAQVWSSGVLATNDVSTFLTSGYAGLVDTIEIIGGPQGGYAMDDFTFHDAVAAVPEPGTYALMFAGLGVVGFVARRRRSANAA